MSWNGLRKLHRPSHGFWTRLNRAEALLVKAVLFGVVLLALVQAANDQDPIEREFKVSKLLEEQVSTVTVGFGSGETFPAEGTAGIAGMGSGTDGVAGVITLRLVNYFSVTGIKVLINGVEQANFLHKDVTLNVRTGDQIALDGSSFPREAEVQILNTTPGIVNPKEGSRVLLKGDVKYLEPVRGKTAAGS